MIPSLADQDDNTVFIVNRHSIDRFLDGRVISASILCDNDVRFLFPEENRMEENNEQEQGNLCERNFHITISFQVLYF
jgi:hypothetical protein